MNKVQFKTRKEVSTFLKEKNIDTTNWTEEKWQSINNSQAEIHMQALAEAMWDAMNESIPNQLYPGDWHIPNLGHEWDNDKLNKIINNTKFESLDKDDKLFEQLLIKISTAHCAKISYNNFGTKIDYEKDIKLHDRLLNSRHASPMEHPAQCMNDSNWYGNFRGWKQYRKMLEENGSL